MTTERPRRRFTLLDAAVLIAATAIALVPIRDFLNPDHAPWFHLVSENPRNPLRMMGWSLPFATLWTLALIPLGFRRSQTRTRRRHIRPGMAACVAAAANLSGAFVSVLAVQGYFWLSIGKSMFLIQIQSVGDLIGSELSFAPLAGLGVLTAWGTLAALHRWRAEPDWLDRMGRVLGLYWIMTIPIFLIYIVR